MQGAYHATCLESINPEHANYRRVVTLRRWSQVFRSQTASLTDLVPTISSRRERQRAWTYEMEGIFRQLGAAKAQWNAYALPCLLPNEVLAYIFEIWSHIDGAYSSSYGSMTYAGWMSVTKICQHFRAVALGHAALWTTLNRDYPWRLFLARSRYALLSVNTAGMMESVYLPSIVANSERIRTLHLECPSSHAATEILKLDVPNMQRLLVRFGLSRDSTPYKLDDGFLASCPLQMHSLSLECVRIPWLLASPISIRSLWLTNCDPLSYPLASVLSCLNNMPLLEELRLYHSLPDAHDHDSVVSLPHLNGLTLTEDDGRALPLWACLELPINCCTELTLGEMDYGDVDHDRLIGAIKTYLKRPGVPTYNAFVLGYNEATTVNFFYLSVRSFQSPPYNIKHESINEYPSLTILSSPINGRELECPVVSLFPVEFVHIIALCEFLFMRPPTVAQMLFKFTALETIEVTGSATAGKFLLSFIASFPALERTPSTEHAYLPALRVLCVKNVHFDSTIPLLYTTPDITENMRLHNLLKQVLERRSAEGVGIRMLTMQSCFTSDVSWVQPCEEYVVTLHWERPREESHIDMQTWEEYEYY